MTEEALEIHGGAAPQPPRTCQPSNKKIKKTESFKCESCPFQTKTKRHLKGHVMTKHPDKAETLKLDFWFECEFCPYKTIYSSSFNEHKIRKHTCLSEIVWYHCKYCRYRAKKSYEITKHHRNIHEDPEKYHYLPQGKCCPDEETVNFIKCQECSFKTICKEWLKRHERSHSNCEKVTWFNCGHCSYKTVKKFDLKKHVICRHTEPDKIQWFECETCAFKAKTKESLRRHWQSRHGGRMGAK